MQSLGLRARAFGGAQLAQGQALPSSLHREAMSRHARRIMNLVLATLLLISALPLLALLALCIRLDSRGPVFFKQTRIGRYGRPFQMYKLRSMINDADPGPHREHVRALIQGQALEGKPSWRKLGSDARVTPFGKFLRCSNLDELPQLFNVMRGEMSIVGPRPALPYEVEVWEDWHHRRLSVRPGITGLWQVDGLELVDFDGMVHLDLEYISRQSLGLDLAILGRTPLALARRRGAG